MRLGEDLEMDYKTSIPPASKYFTEKEDAHLLGVMEKQVGGTHYKKYKFQVWDIVDEYELDYYEGNALKYLLRKKNNRIEDLEKCIHYIEKRINDLKAGNETPRT